MSGAVAMRALAGTWRERLAALGGWRRAFVLAFLGAASMLAFAPFFLWPILWLTLPALYAMLPCAPIDRAAIRKAAVTGWWFGFGYHLAGLYWIGAAFLVDADVFGWLLPFAVTIMPAGLALFTAATTAATAMLVPSGGIMRVLALALAFGITEWLRGHILTGFPWNILGYALTQPLVLMQSAGVLGIYGLTIVAVLVFVLPAELLRLAHEKSDSRWRVAAIAAALAPLAVMTLYGVYRINLPVDSADHTSARIRIVQPSILQREKWRGEHQRRIFDEHLALSLTAPDGTIDGAAGISMILWPEAAMPFMPLDQPVALADIGRMLPPSAILMSGALRVEPATADRPRMVYNSLLAFGPGSPSRFLQGYDKTHLVPFGEYLPLQRFLEAIGLEQLSRLRGGFASGPEPRGALAVAGVGDLAPLVCYEALFPGKVVQTTARPRALLNVTNDGWFGDTTGPRQHFHMSRVRAVEEGLPLIRAGNNGISAIVDSRGAITHVLDLNIRGTIDAGIPARIPAPVYARLGDFPFAGLSFALLMVVLARKLQFFD